MKISKAELERMAIQTDSPAAARVTTVSNVSTTTRFPVEKSSAASQPPPTRPQQAPRPAVLTAQPTARLGVSKAQSPLRRDLESRVHNPGAVGRRPTAVRPPVIFTNRSDGPPEGVGSGTIPPGGIKLR